MKLRDLKLWPPRWVEFSGRQIETVAEEGVLEAVQRLGNRLLLQININGLRRTAILQ